jgi:hypothetical protein
LVSNIKFSRQNRQLIFDWFRIAVVKWAACIKPALSSINQLLTTDFPGRYHINPDIPLILNSTEFVFWGIYRLDSEV